MKQAAAVKCSPRYLTAVVLHGDGLCMFGAVGPEIVREQDPGQVQLELDYSQVGDPTVLSR